MLRCLCTNRSPLPAPPSHSLTRHAAIAMACKQLDSAPCSQVQARYTDRVIGCFLDALCGDALGAAVEGWSASRIQAVFPEGLTEFQGCRMGRGRYTDDSQMLLALAASLVNSGGDCRAADVATEYAKAFDPNRGYGESAEKARTARCENSALHRYQQVLAGLQAQLNAGPLRLPSTPGTPLLNPGGSYGNGGAMRVAPLGLVYRNAPLQVLHAALLQSLTPTNHLHPVAVEGALVQALAVAFLSKHDLQQPGASTSGAGAGADVVMNDATMPPKGAMQLLLHLQGHLQGHDWVMRSRLERMKEGLQQLYTPPHCPKLHQQSWREYFQSPAWTLELSIATAVAPGEFGGGFQIKATDAVAATLWACLAHWDGDPKDAVTAAVHYGGDTDTTACMAGALVGALHGTSCLPKEWLLGMEQDRAHMQFFNSAVVEAMLHQDAVQPSLNPEDLTATDPTQKPTTPGGAALLDKVQQPRPSRNTTLDCA